MTESKVRIESVGVEWANRIAELHAEALPDDILAQLGQPFLSRIFYPLLIETSDVALAAFVDDEVVGYAILSSDRGLYRRLLRAHGLRIAGTVIKNCVRPRFIANLLSVVRFMITSRDPGSPTEFSYLAVDSEHRYGVGLLLVRAGLSRLKEMGIRSCWVKTLESTPRVVMLYKALGFRIKARTAGRVILIKEL